MSAPFAARFVTYLNERFPPLGNGILAALLCAGSIAAFRARAGLTIPDVLVAFGTVFPLLFVMRVADEHKDHAEDAAFRPERPVPRGLVSLRELRVAAAIAGALSLALVLVLSPLSLVPLVAAMLWIGAMSVEFGVKEWLRARPVVYLVSHMLVMPLLALLAVSVAAETAGDLYAASLPLVLALAFAAGLVLEIGRKLWGADEEREGVETYSRLWGTTAASHIWSAIALAAVTLAAAIAGWHPLAMVTAAASGLAVLVIAGRYRARPDARRARAVRAAAVLVVVLAYGLCIAGDFL